MRSLVLFILLLLPLDAAATVYSARQLYPMVTKGIPVLERRSDGGILHVKPRLMSKAQKEQIEKLAALGYVDGSVNTATETVGLKIRHKAPAIQQVTVVSQVLGGEKCSVRLVVSSAKGKVLYAKNQSLKEAAREKKASTGVLTFDVGLEGHEDGYSVHIQFKGCKVAIREVEI